MSAPTTDEILAMTPRDKELALVWLAGYSPDLCRLAMDRGRGHYVETHDAAWVLRKASFANQSGPERANVAGGRCWCGEPVQTLPHDEDHECKQCAKHCAIAAYKQTLVATIWPDRAAQ